MLSIRGHIWIVCLLLTPAGSIAQSLQLADSLRIKGEKFQERGNFKESEFYYNKAFNLYQTHRDTASWLMTGIYYAEVLSYQSEIDESITLLNSLKSISHPANSDSLKARIETDLGWIYKQQGKLDNSLQHLKKGLTYAQRAKDSLIIGISLNNLAGTYSKKNNRQQALEYYKRALPIFENLDNKRSQAYALSNIGNIYRKLLLFDKTLEYYSRSLQIAKQLENVNLQAYAHNSMGKLHKDLGNYDQALIQMHQSLKYRRQANNLQEVASTLNTIGTLYDDMGNNKKSIQYYHQSLAIWKKVANPAQLAVANKNIGAVLSSLGNHDEATHYYQRALVLKREFGDKRAIATSLLDLASVKRTQRSYPAAYDYIKKASIIADSSQDRELLRQVSLSLGRLHIAEGNIAGAATNYKEALTYSRALGKNTQLAPLKELAYVYNTLDSDSAMYYGRQAIDLIEQNRMQTGPLLEFKAGYFKKHSDFYVDLASWTIKYDKDASGAFRLVESAKARALTDELSQAARRIDESLPEEKRLQRARKLAEISRLYSQMNSTSDSTDEKNIKTQIRDKELAYAAFENKLQQQNSQYKSLKSPEPVALQKVHEKCDTETAILEYAISGNQLLAFYITNDSILAKQIAIGIQDSTIDHATLASQVMQFREAIISRASIDSIRTLSGPIYHKLITPFQDKLVNKKNLIIVPDAFLAYLPFEALSINNNYLVSEYNIKYTPSMTSFSLISKPDAVTKNNILTIANANRYSTGENTAILPTVNLEVNTISELFNNTTILKDADVTEENVKKHIQQKHSIVHIAAHSVIDEKNSSQSGIILHSNNNNGLGNDGYLRNNEIYQLKISSDMIVLSACKSGIGQMINGEGMLGLQRAFFNAGASSVVVSLWDVYDRPTTHFMQLFYKSLINAPSNRSWTDSWQSLLRWSGWDKSEPFGYTASSIREAKLAMLNHPQYHHPVYWAPFISVGR